MRPFFYERIQGKPNLAVGIWLGALTLVWVYDIVMFVLKSWDQESFIIVSIFLAAMYLYFLGCRPYEYIVDGKNFNLQKKIITSKRSRLNDMRSHLSIQYQEWLT